MVKSKPSICTPPPLHIERAFHDSLDSIMPTIGVLREGDVKIAFPTILHLFHQGSVESKCGDIPANMTLEVTAYSSETRASPSPLKPNCGRS